MKILVDMNLSPAWVSVLAAAGHEAVHWAAVGDPRAADRTIFRWAEANTAVVLTNDLDFGAILASLRDARVSVIQLRTQNVTPAHAAGAICRVLTHHAELLSTGVLISVAEERARIRMLPLR